MGLPSLLEKSLEIRGKVNILQYLCLTLDGTQSKELAADRKVLRLRERLSLP